MITKKLPAKMSSLSVPRSLSHINEYKIAIKMETVPKIGLSHTIGIFVATFQDPYFFIPYLFL